MKVLVCIALMNFAFLYSQNYKVIYKMTYKPDSASEKMYTKNMLLEVNNDFSTFYSYRMYQSDSIYSLNKTLGDNRFIDYDFMVKRNKSEFWTKKYYKISIFNNEIFAIKERKLIFNWKIIDETKKIDGYNCQKAELSYKGRNWEAWFATDITLQEGPFIFNGLPGLIVYMKDSKNNYFFQVIGLQKLIENNSTTNFFSGEIEVTRKQLNQMLTDRFNDPFKEMRLQNLIFEGERLKDRSQLFKNEREQIKKYNNPIELSEAVKYP